MMFRDSISRGLAAICAGLLIAGCDRQSTAPPPGQDAAELKPLASHNAGAPTATRLVTGLVEGSGSAIGPDGALYVPEPQAGRISRVDPKSGTVTTFASGLPRSLFKDPGNGGILDVAFIGGTAYALIDGVASDLGGNDVVGIYRIDGPTSFTVVADLGEYALRNPPPPPIDYFVPTGWPYAMEPYHGGFLVTDGHFNRVLKVSLDGDIANILQFGNIVPTGLALWGNTVYMTEAGPIPHLPENGKLISFGAKSPSPTLVASGARLLVDVEFGPGRTLYALAQGFFTPGHGEGTPAEPNTGSLVKVNANGTFTVITEGLNQPTSLEFIGNDAYVVTLGGEVWRIANVSH